MQAAPARSLLQLDPTPKPLSWLAELRLAAVLCVPTAFDLVATILMNVGLLSMRVSVYQMLRGASELLFARVFAAALVRRRCVGAWMRVGEGGVCSGWGDRGGHACAVQGMPLNACLWHDWPAGELRDVSIWVPAPAHKWTQLHACCRPSGLHLMGTGCSIVGIIVVGTASVLAGALLSGLRAPTCRCACPWPGLIRPAGKR